MRTIAYVDAFNLYYGSLRGTPHKWLNLAAYFAQAFPDNHITRIRYFTAPVNDRPSDPDQSQRQRTYLRALETLPEVSIHLGQYLETKVWAQLVTPLPDGTQKVKVRKSEEKGSDVNLATYMVLDAAKDQCEAALVVTNDSDLTEPIRVVRREFGKRVLVVQPCCNGRRGNRELMQVASKAVRVDATILAASQFPVTMPDAHGMIHKPPAW